MLVYFTCPKCQRRHDWDNSSPVAPNCPNCGYDVTGTNERAPKNLLTFASKNDLASVQTLVEAAKAGQAVFDLEAKNAGGFTALIIAAQRGNEGLVELLLDGGASVHAVNNQGGDGPLHVAARERHGGVVDLLLAQGAPVDALNGGGMSALHLATIKGDLLIAQLLLTAGADVNGKTTDGSTALHLAVEEGQRRIAEFLIDHGADVNAQHER